MATISIVMPVYNSKEYLKEAINSILDQTYTDWEFLIINEFGSDDGSKEIIEEYAKYDKRIILIQNEERLGIAASMNVGIDRASGKYVARMDADDISLPERFEKQVKFMNDNPDIGMCGCKVEIFGSDPFEWKLETDKNKLNTNILFYSPSVHPTVMIRKEILDTYNLRYNEDYKASEDYELFSRICSITSVANIDEVLFRYRIMKNNATFRNNDIGIVLYSKVMENQFKKMGLEFTEQEIQLLSPHYSMKQTQGRDVLVKLSNLDLLLKKILVSNEKCKLYDRKYLSNTLHKRFEEAYNSISWECKDYDRKKVDEIYDKSIFKNEFFYEKKIKKENITPIVTVLLPAYNSEKYIADTIWSVLDQTFSDFELLIVNEFGSNDDTVQIINMFDDPRIKIIQNKERLGLAESLNLGMKEAKGKYIARIDADDLCSKNRFELQVEFLDKNEEYGVCGSWQHHFGIDTDYIHKVPMSNEDLKAAFIYNCELCHSTLMLRKKYFIDNNLFFDKNAAAEDYELWTRAIYKFKFANIPRVLGEYRIGEDNITAKKMEELSNESAKIVANNIKQYFDIDVPEKHKKFMTGWINEFKKIDNKELYDEELKTEKSILYKMWKSNNKNHVFEEKSLLKVLARRWNYVTSSNINYDNIEKIEEIFIKQNDSNLLNNSIHNIKSSLIKRCIKKVCKPFYNAIKRRTVDKLEQHLWDLEGHIKDIVLYNKCDLEKDLKNEYLKLVNKMDGIYKENYKNLECKYDSIHENYRKLECKYNSIEQYYKEFEGKYNFILEQIGKATYKIDDTQGNIHRHIDFTYRDIMIVLENKLNFINQPAIKLETKFPIAYESNDYKVPHGTIRDNTRYPRFVRKCEQIFLNKERLKFLDLGCSGGGMVLDAIIRGHVGIGLEGNDASLIQQRAEWRLLKDCLFTCDITKPFKLYNQLNRDKYEKFDVITAWEVLEHIQDEDLDQLFENLLNHLEIGGIFVASIANWDDIDPITGVNWHVNTHDYDWWKERFTSFGFEVCSELVSTEDLARGGINPPHCFERPYDDYDTNKTFHIVVKNNK